MKEISPSQTFAWNILGVGEKLKRERGRVGKKKTKLIL